MSLLFPGEPVFYWQGRPTRANLIVSKGDVTPNFLKFNKDRKKKYAQNSESHAQPTRPDDVLTAEKRLTRA